MRQLLWHSRQEAAPHLQALQAGAGWAGQAAEEGCFSRLVEDVAVEAQGVQLGQACTGRQDDSQSLHGASRMTAWGWRSKC